MKKLLIAATALMLNSETNVNAMDEAQEARLELKIPQKYCDSDRGDILRTMKCFSSSICHKDYHVDNDMLIDSTIKIAAKYPVTWDCCILYTSFYVDSSSAENLCIKYMSEATRYRYPRDFLYARLAGLSGLTSTTAAADLMQFLDELQSAVNIIGNCDPSVCDKIFAIEKSKKLPILELATLVKETTNILNTIGATHPTDYLIMKATLLIQHQNFEEEKSKIVQDAEAIKHLHADWNSEDILAILVKKNARRIKMQKSVKTALPHGTTSDSVEEDPRALAQWDKLFGLYTTW